MDHTAAGKFNQGLYGHASAENGNTALRFSIMNLELSLQKEESFQGVFTILAPEGTVAEGYVYSTDFRMTCLTRQFVGGKEEIAYSFSAEGMEPGEVLRGKFLVISSCGEYELPFRAELKETAAASTMGEIRNMFHFANLARANWEEAVRVFYSKEFGSIFTDGLGRQYYSAYKGLSGVYGSQQNMEEFLLEINKKQPVEFSLERSELLFEEPDGTEEYGLTLTRSGWGYTFIRIEAEGDFLRIEKDSITDNDFLGNTCRLLFYIDGHRLHGGHNYGSLRLFNSYMDVRVPVTVLRRMKRKRAYDIHREKKGQLIRLTEQYCDFRGKKISAKTWLGETERLLDRLAALDSRDIQTKLFQAQLLITRECFREVGWQLERIGRELEEGHCAPELWCYYLYLSTLYHQDEEYVDEVTAKVEEIYRANQGNWRIAWLVMHLSEEYEKNVSRRWALLEEQFRLGCVSPVLYAEAWHLLELDPSLFLKLNAFELQVLNFAAKRGMISRVSVVWIRYQIQKLKAYSERAFFILTECYESFPDSETLHAICSLLIKGNRTDRDSFFWYGMGVEQDLRITRLYEYYMMSLPEDYEEELPRKVLMYFAYQSELDYKKNAFLYSYICRRKEEHPEYYMLFLGQIENFVLEQIHKGRISRDLACLYKVFLPHIEGDGELAMKLLPLLFTHILSTEDRKMRQVIVRYAVSSEEYRYPVSDGRAQVPLYGDDYKILLEDMDGNRYTVSADYHLEQLLQPENYLSLISPYVQEHQGLDIYLCEGGKSFAEITDENVSRFRHIAFSSHIESAKKSEISLKLLHYYYDKDHIRELDEYLERLEPEETDGKGRREVIRFLVIRGLYDKAFAWMKRFGIHGMEIKTLVRLCSRLISRDGFVEDREMTQIIYHTFEKGKYDANLLAYLVKFYHGPLERLEAVRRSAEAFEVDVYELCERMLLQMLFTGSLAGEWPAVFRAYVSGGAKAEVEAAFLARCCHNCFIGRESLEPFIFTEVMRLSERGEKLEKACKLAFLQHYSSCAEELADRVRKTACLFLEELLEEGICFRFFKKYARLVPAMERLQDKTIIEYRGSVGGSPVIHYLLEDGQALEKEYKSEAMQEMYEGIYAKAFVLFFGERLRYYITEKQGDEEVITLRSSQGADAPIKGEDNRFAMLNAVVAGRVLGDYERVDRLLEDYYRKEYVVSALFPLL